jgi:hypothetical protein
MDAAFIACVLNYQSHFHLNAQNTSSRKQVEDPTMLNKLQGTWMSAIPGEALWFKVENTQSLTNP